LMIGGRYEIQLEIEKVKFEDGDKAWRMEEELEDFIEKTA